MVEADHESDSFDDFMGPTGIEYDENVQGKQGSSHINHGGAAF